MPLPFVLARRTDRREATYVTVAGDPTCRMRIKARGRRTFDFVVECRANGDTSVPLAPSECDAGAPSTNLVTR